MMFLFPLHLCLLSIVSDASSHQLSAQTLKTTGKRIPIRPDRIYNSLSSCRNPHLKNVDLDLQFVCDFAAFCDQFVEKDGRYCYFGTQLPDFPPEFAEEFGEWMKTYEKAWNTRSYMALKKWISAKDGNFAGGCANGQWHSTVLDGRFVWLMNQWINSIHKTAIEFAKNTNLPGIEAGMGFGSIDTGTILLCTELYNIILPDPKIVPDPEYRILYLSEEQLEEIFSKGQKHWTQEKVEQKIEKTYQEGKDRIRATRLPTNWEKTRRELLFRGVPKNPLININSVQPEAKPTQEETNNEN